LRGIKGALAVSELPTDESAHSFELDGDRGGDLRADLFRLAVGKKWTLLELRRDAQTLDDVFRDLTRADERRDRGLKQDDDEPRQGGGNAPAATLKKQNSDERRKEAAVGG
jgi:ABC-2 type transport system ATP-binding protein